jgi:hypothetical protein
MPESGKDPAFWNCPWQQLFGKNFEKRAIGDKMLLWGTLTKSSMPLPDSPIEGCTGFS